MLSEPCSDAEMVAVPRRVSTMFKLFFNYSESKLHPSARVEGNAHLFSTLFSLLSHKAFLLAGTDSLLPHFRSSLPFTSAFGLVMEVSVQHEAVPVQQSCIMY